MLHSSFEAKKVSGEDWKNRGSLSWCLALINVTFHSLSFTVRDSAARLPNGEGTRADICELLKDSQYLATGVTDAQV